MSRANRYKLEPMKVQQWTLCSRSRRLDQHGPSAYKATSPRRGKPGSVMVRHLCYLCAVTFAENHKLPIPQQTGVER